MNMSKTHIWMGINNNENYEEYFELDYNLDIDIDSPEYKICGFCKDINERFYDEDFIGVYQYDELESIDFFLDEASLSGKELEKAKEICYEKGFKEVNAMFYYMDSSIVVSDKSKLYNGLAYIGQFEID